jgi:hypothetical protein
VAKLTGLLSVTLTKLADGFGLQSNPKLSIRDNGKDSYSPPLIWFPRFQRLLWWPLKLSVKGGKNYSIFEKFIFLAVLTFFQNVNKS